MSIGGGKRGMGRAAAALAAVVIALALVLADSPAATAAMPASRIIGGFPAVQQWYSLSCEYAAAAAVTLYYGRLVSQRDFLPAVPRNPNPHLGFRGDITGPWGGIADYGVYAEPLVPVLRAAGYQAFVAYKGGAGWLRAQLAAGRPVVVWMTGRRGVQPVPYETLAGARFRLVPYEHATVVYGYDGGGIWDMDVGDGGKYYYAWSSFLARWAYFDDMALVIVPGW